MKAFMDKDFLLSNNTATRLYHEAAAAEPIFDYHCHLIPQEIAENRRFSDLTQIWLSTDHYKWRAMRANGIDERFITGDADPYEKFLAWAETVPRLIGNPLYHWTHLELQRYFDINEAFNPDTAPAVWKTANEKLQSAEWLSVHGIFKHFNVYAVGTTDDPSDTLTWHKKIAGSSEIATMVLPSFRPDMAIDIDKPGFVDYIKKLGTAAGSIKNFDDLHGVLVSRVDYFDHHGCRVSDHALEYIPFAVASDGSTGVRWLREVSDTFATVMEGSTISREAVESYKTYLLTILATEYHRHGWAMQLHLAALRSINTNASRTLGASTGYDVVHDHPIAAKLASFLDLLNTRNIVPKTILYSLNPKDFYPLSTIIGSFQGGGIPGRMQLGSAWWFLDSKDGMESQMKLLGNTGLLSRFIGMLTDSRSFLSYPRHEYFRRILCNIIGTWVEDGEIPNDWTLLSGMVHDISFRNAQKYFE
jgi:glucuronate isomerase